MDITTENPKIIPEGEEEFRAEEINAELEADLAELAEEFPETAAVSNIAELRCGSRYSELRELGLSAREAYLATAPRAALPDTRAHLSDSFPRPSRSPRTAMTRAELHEAREIFAGLDDSQIMELYRKVTR